MYYWLTKHLTIYIFLQTCGVWKNQNTEFQCWKRQNPEFQCLEKPKFTILMFGKAKTLNSNVEKAKIQNANVWISENTEMQFFEKQNSWIPMFVKCRTLNFNFFKSQNPEFHVMFGKRKPLNSDVWKNWPKAESPMFGRDIKHWITLYGKGKIQNSNVCKSKSTKF